MFATWGTTGRWEEMVEWRRTGSGSETLDASLDKI